MSHSWGRGGQAFGSMEEVVDHMVDEVTAEVNNGGLAIILIHKDDGDPTYAASVGLTRVGCPEVTISGLPVDLSHLVMVRLFEMARDGYKFADGVRSDDVFEGLPVTFRTVDHEFGQMVFMASEKVCGDLIGRLQLVWSDPEGRFPWDEGCPEFVRSRQPDRWERMDLRQAPLVAGDEEDHSRVLRQMVRPRRLN